MVCLLWLRLEHRRRKFYFTGGRETSGLETNGKVSVIIPNYNYAQYLAEAIESVLQQTYKNIEVIVVNNGSTDNSLEILEKYSNLIFLVNQENLGQSGARKSGLDRATGEFIAFLDADDKWDKQKIEKQLLLFTPKVELVYCGVNHFSESAQKIIATQLPTFRGSCSDAFIDYPGVSIVLSGESTSIFTRSLLNKVGGFDSGLNSAGGWDFFRRCSKFTDFDFVSEPLVNYRRHSSNMSNSYQNTIIDIRLAYKKLFADNLWKLSPIKIRRIIITLEYTFFKTHLSKRQYRKAIATAARMFFLKGY
jgi:glycosyltransferase involved in cell wall biosynthesis